MLPVRRLTFAPEALENTPLGQEGGLIPRGIAVVEGVAALVIRPVLVAPNPAGFVDHLPGAPAPVAGDLSPDVVEDPLPHSPAESTTTCTSSPDNN